MNTNCFETNFVIISEDTDFLHGILTASIVQSGLMSALLIINSQESNCLRFYGNGCWCEDSFTRLRSKECVWNLSRYLPPLQT